MWSLLLSSGSWYTQDFVCALQDWSLFPPVLWKSYNQTPLASRSDSPGIPSPFVGSLGWEAWRGVQDLHHSGRTSLVLFSSLWVTHLADTGLEFIMIVPLLRYCCSFFFVFGCGVSFFDGFQHPPIDGCSTVSCDFGALTGGDKCTSFYSVILNQEPPITSLMLFALYSVPCIWSRLGYYRCWKCRTIKDIFVNFIVVLGSNLWEFYLSGPSLQKIICP